jgi:tetratricopeptide (TPR) repeat protein
LLSRVELLPSIFICGHGAAGARAVTTAEPGLEEGPDAEEALKVFARAANLAPDDPDHHFILGRALIDAGRPGEALPALRQAIQLHPDSAEYRLSLAHALWRAGRFPQAAAAFAVATQLAPDEASAWSGLGAARLAAGSVDEALPALEEALALGPQQADAQSNLGVALWQMGDPEAALEAFEAATRLDPGQPLAHRNRGRALLALDRGAESLAALAAARRLAPDDAALCVDMAEAQLRVGSDDEAYASLREALEISPTCLDERPQAREAFLALEADALRQERPDERSALAPVVGGVLAATAAVGEPLGRLLSFRRRALAWLGIALLVVALYPFWHLAPVYVRHFLFVDDLKIVASTPLSSDYEVAARLRHTAERRGLGDVMDANSCQITSTPRWRTIACHYSVSVALLPGLKRSITLHTSVERFFVPLDQVDVPGGG